VETQCSEKKEKRGKRIFKRRQGRKKGGLDHGDEVWMKLFDKEQKKKKRGSRYLTFQKKGGEKSPHISTRQMGKGFIAWCGKKGGESRKGKGQLNSENKTLKRVIAITFNKGKREKKKTNPRHMERPLS